MGVVEKTALAEAEVEYEDYTSDTVWVKFPIAGTASQQDKASLDLLDASVVIWTTTPWTIPGNRAISFSPKIVYGLYEVTEAPDGNWAVKGDKFILADKLADDVMKQARVAGFRKLRALIDGELYPLQCAHPLVAFNPGYGFAVPLLEGEHVTDDAGTGFVHTAPGHGREDFEVWTLNARDLETRDINTAIPYTVDENGTFTEAAPGFTGKRVINDKGEKGDANEAVIKALVGAGMLIARGRLKHQYPHSWRSKKPIIFRNTPQWFIAMDKPVEGMPPVIPGRREAAGPESRALDSGFAPSARPGMTGGGGDTLRARALHAISVTRWVPPQGENRITGMIESRPDWVISRQRAWGVPIAVFIKEKPDGSVDILQDPEVEVRIVEAFEAEGADAWYAAGGCERFLGQTSQTKVGRRSTIFSTSGSIPAPPTPSCWRTQVISRSLPASSARSMAVKTS